jgi:hypothetical protein
MVPWSLTPSGQPVSLCLCCCHCPGAQATINHGDHYHPHIIHAKLREDLDAYDIIQTCMVDFELSHDNKGFESILYLRNRKGGSGAACLPQLLVAH